MHWMLVLETVGIEGNEFHKKLKKADAPPKMAKYRGLAKED